MIKTFKPMILNYLPILISWLFQQDIFSSWPFLFTGGCFRLDFTSILEIVKCIQLIDVCTQHMFLNATIVLFIHFSTGWHVYLLLLTTYPVLQDYILSTKGQLGEGKILYAYVPLWSHKGYLGSHSSLYMYT